MMPSVPRSTPDLDLANEQGEDRSRFLANLAVSSLISEIELTPKPALVDERGSGAHTDLSAELMRCSARSLRGSFELIALASFRQIPSQSLREKLGAIGRCAEQSMLRTTAGINTHRGAIWAFGLLVSAASMGSNSPKALANRAGELARLPDWNAPREESHGWNAIRRYKMSGAREEARAGFPHVIAFALPMLHRSRRLGASETEARLNALLAIMTSLDDTCLLHRGGLRALHAARRGAAAVLGVGGTATVRGWKLLQQLEDDLIALNASPGGCADLLASTLFLDSLASDPSSES